MTTAVNCQAGLFHSRDRYYKEHSPNQHLQRMGQTWAILVGRTLGESRGPGSSLLAYPKYSGSKLQHSESQDTSVALEIPGRKGSKHYPVPDR